MTKPPILLRMVRKVLQAKGEISATGMANDLGDSRTGILLALWILEGAGIAIRVDDDTWRYEP